MKYKDLEKLKNAKAICLIGHRRPDFDAIGSMVAFKSILMRCFKVGRVDIFADQFIYTDYYSDVISESDLNPKPTKYDFAIAMDCSTYDMMCDYATIFDATPVTFRIDHHATGDKYAQHNLVEQTSSTCELVYKIAKHFGIKLTPFEYKSLYCGLLTDTMGLSVGVLKKSTYELAYNCNRNLDITPIYQKCLEYHTAKNMKVLSLAIENMEVLCEGKLCFAYLTKEQMEQNGFLPHDFVGICNYLATLSTSKATCFFRPEKDKINVELRCKKGYDVGSYAKQNGGGGHTCASGFSSVLDVATLSKQLKTDLSKLVEHINK